MEDVIRAAVGGLLTGGAIAYIACWFTCRKQVTAIESELRAEQEYGSRLLEEPAFYRDQIRTYLGVASPRFYGLFGRIDYHGEANCPTALEAQEGGL